MLTESRQSQLFILGTLVHALISLWNIRKDYWVLSGPDGLLPDSQILFTIAEDYSVENLIKYFPSLLYMVDAWWVIHVGLFSVLVGITAALLRRLSWARISCGIVYVCLLSFSQSRGMLVWFPWDCLLFEMLVLSVLAPSSSFARRYLLFRVMFGFGKHKFLGAHEFEDWFYTSSMACWQPLGSSLGWYLTFLPSWVHVISIIVTFIAEIICPFIIMFGWGGRIWVRVSCGLTILLMAMIQVSGHFGWFNTLTAWLGYIVMRDIEVRKHIPIPAESGKTGRNLFRKSFKALYILLGFIFLIPSQWNSPAMFYQHSFEAPQWDLVRVVSSWRLLHTYGVFPPKKLPAIKPIGRFEVVLSDNTVQPLEYMYQHSGSADGFQGFFPLSVAPFRFPRFDYIYAFYGASNVWSLATRLGPIVSSGEEYLDSVALAIMERKPVVKSLFKHSIPDDQPIVKVILAVVGIVPEMSSGGWKEVSREISKEWNIDHNFSLAVKPFSYGLPPGSVVLRQTSLSYINDVKTDISSATSPQCLFNKAVELARAESTFFLISSEKKWLSTVEEKYYSISGTIPFFGCEYPSLWSLCHSMEFAGYLGCLTFLHLVPPALHSPVCPAVMAANKKKRTEGDNRFAKIPIDPMVEWMLGIDSQ